MINKQTIKNTQIIIFLAQFNATIDFYKFY